MFKEKKIVRTTKWLFNLYAIDDFDGYDEEACGEDFGLCLEEVVLASRNSTQIVREYEVDGSIEFAFRYKSKKLFGQQVIKLCSEMEVGASTDQTNVSYYTELWLSEDMSFTVTHCIEMSHDDGIVYESRYRTFIQKVRGREDLFFAPKGLIDTLGELCVPIWENGATIYELQGLQMAAFSLEQRSVMREYDVEITETLEKTVTVQAVSQTEAEGKAEEAWNDSEYMLDSGDFVGAKFITKSERVLENSLTDVLLVEPGQYPKQIKIGSDFDDLREAVDGNIECTYPSEDEVGVILNGCRKLLGLPLNRAMHTGDGEVYDIYAGPFLVVGSTEDNFGPFSPELVEKFETKFHQPGMFVKMGKGMMVLPIPEESMKIKERGKGLEQKVKTFPEFGDM